MDMAEKLTLATNFLGRKMEEYLALKTEIEELRLVIDATVFNGQKGQQK